ncbi:MAG: prolipoprotein diacylglyceryl transferase family protein [Nakamurella sp.]
MRPVLFSWGGVDVGTHEFFVGAGVATALVVFVLEARARGQWNSGTVIAVCGALIGGAVGMRLSGLLPHLSAAANPTLVEAWEYGARSILGGLTGAYVGVLIAKRIIGYRVSTGDLFAPAVAIGMAVGRIGCLLTEAPGRPTTLPWAVHAPSSVAQCPGCLAGVGMHPSYLYEIIFQSLAFVGLLWLRGRVTYPGLLLTSYLAGYAAFRFLVEFTRANPTVWLGLTRPQWFVLILLPLVIWRLVVRFRSGAFADVLTRRSPRREVHP